MPNLPFGYTLQNFTAILQDLRSSNYFRIWSLTWFFGLVLTLVSFFTLSIRSSQSGNMMDIQFWLEFPTEINYPTFHIQCADNLVFNTFACVHKTSQGTALPVLTRNCPDGEGNKAVCQTVIADGIAVKSTEVDSADSIYCFVTTNNINASNNLNQMIKFQTEGAGWNPSVWFAPNNKTAIGLVKSSFDLDGDDTTAEVSGWQAQLEYRDTVSSPYLYHVEVSIASLGISHYEQADRYDGWRSSADIGGFAFLCVIIQTILMLIVDFFLAKESRFLTGKLTHAQAGYAEIGADNKL